MGEAAKMMGNTQTSGSVFAWHNEKGNGNFLLICEHASNHIPPRYFELGLPNDTRKSHIAWDPGAIEVAKKMSELMDAPLIAQNISRLVYDCNRPTAAKSAIPEKSEIYEIPGNHNLNQAQIQERIETVYMPFREEVLRYLGQKRTENVHPVIVTVHTFTPIYHGENRSVEIGILHDKDSRLADQMLDNVSKHNGYRLERNAPYGPENGVTHSLIEYGIKNKLANVMIEIRNDLVETDDQQNSIAHLLAELSKSAASNLQMNEQVARA